DAAILPPSLQFVLPHTGIAPGTFDVAWQVNGSPVTASDDGLGALKIGATVVGSINYASGDVSVRPPTLPDVGTQLACTYDWSPAQQDTFTPTVDGTGNVVIDLGGPIKPGSLVFNWTASLTIGDSPTGAVHKPIALIARDDGAGNLLAVSAGGAAWSGTVGSVDNATGMVTLKTSGNSHGEIASNPVYVIDGGGVDTRPDWTLG
ncbi:hypothetical protein SNE32_15635, partial [Lysobacter sp. D1-1-M9]